MSFIRRKPIDAVSIAMKESGDYIVPFNNIAVTKKDLSKSYSRQDAGISEVSTGDISLSSVPEYLMFALVKKGYSSGEMGTFAKITKALT